ncbi:MAG: PaaI family thioesterase [Anaeroplasmataceae bacterium]|nr:PaaI family thioesterase [Anaeroplasmataceae bacterium]
MKVIKKQNNSKMCMICGMDNTFGVQAQFYELEDNSVCGIFKFKEEHQSYPGRVHGGMISAMLDELACRAFWVLEPEQLAVTMDLNTKYRKPVPYNEELKGIGRIIKKTNRYFIAECKIFNDAKEVLASGEIKYLILPAEAITDASYEDEMCYEILDDIKEIDVCD